MTDKSNLVEIHSERVGQVSSTDFPHHYDNDLEDRSWSNEKFKNQLKVKITRLSESRIEFDLIGVDASISNAIRRCLLAEVETIAFENVYIWNNTSIIVDEVLSHRLGLIPLKIDPKKLDFKEKGQGPTDRNTIVFKFNVECERMTVEEKKNLPFDISNENGIKNSKIYSNSLQWDPRGTQLEDFKDENPKPVHNDILLVKLRPGQKIKIELHAIKGKGKDHAKFSPVSTASYRLLPKIEILNPKEIKDFEKFIKCFPKGVIGLKKDLKTNQEEVYVKNSRKDSISREVLRFKEFKDNVILSRFRNHFLFDIESTGCYKPQDLLPSAIEVLIKKIKIISKSLDKLEQEHGLSS